MALTFVATPALPTEEPTFYGIAWDQFEPLCAMAAPHDGHALALLAVHCIEGTVQADTDPSVATITAALETFTEADTEQLALRANELGAFLRNAITQRCALTAND